MILLFNKLYESMDARDKHLSRLKYFDNPLISPSSFVRLTSNASCSGKREIVSEKVFNGTCYRVVEKTSFKGAPS